jgi:multidrug efflux pump
MGRDTGIERGDKVITQGIGLLRPNGPVKAVPENTGRPTPAPRRQGSDARRASMSRIFIDRPIFAWVIAIITMMIGVGALMSLPVQQFPILPRHR